MELQCVCEDGTKAAGADPKYIEHCLEEVYLTGEREP
jgi:hypothetical protein